MAGSESTVCCRELTDLLSGKVQVNVGFRQGLIQLLCGLIKILFLSPALGESASWS